MLKLIFKACSRGKQAGEPLEGIVVAARRVSQPQRSGRCVADLLGRRRRPRGNRTVIEEVDFYLSNTYMEAMFTSCSQNRLFADEASFGHPYNPQRTVLMRIRPALLPPLLLDMTSPR
ncbi:hypothetical protein EVAR_78615_1 [Eumeta japonica]|uniref:Uncharacterized protein n=1 Tax=Eumeta variegata TaxID=151549 RepID=A0A4C1U7X8_EUMVA|nr:hypothetical protein EVAR_78615_1 [Eumeta japonica]